LVVIVTYGIKPMILTKTNTRGSRSRKRGRDIETGTATKDNPAGFIKNKLELPPGKLNQTINN
jgi:hypothetical protein